jgi:hypothetical protein
MKASLVPAKFNQPRCAAQQTTAGGVSERNPVRQPSSRQKTSNVMRVAMHLDLGASTLPWQRSYQPLSSVSQGSRHSNLHALLAYCRGSDQPRALSTFQEGRAARSIWRVTLRYQFSVRNPKSGICWISPPGRGLSAPAYRSVSAP